MNLEILAIGCLVAAAIGAVIGMIGTNRRL